MTDRRAFPRLRVAAALLSIVLLAACSGGDDSGAAKATTTTAAVDRAALKADLQGRLLTADDLKSSDALDPGWSAGDVAAGVDIKLPDCVLEAPGKPALATAEAKLVTNNDFKLPSIEQDLATYASGGAAKAFTAAAARLDACQPTFVFQGAEAVGKIERLPLTLGGDQSAAWRTTVTIAGAGVSITSMHVQRGDVEMSLLHVDLGTPDVAVLEGVAAKALAKLA